MKSRCMLVCALAPEQMKAADANDQFNAFVADRDLPLVLFHDHFIGRSGGCAVFAVNSALEHDALADNDLLSGWNVTMHPLVFSRSPIGFDEQIAFTMKTYRDLDWEHSRRVTDKQ